MHYQKSFNSNCLKSLVLTLVLISSAPSAILARPSSLVTPAQAQKQTLLPRHYIPPHDYDTRNITLNLRFDWEREQAIGTATITFSPLISNLRKVEFDAANMTFNSVTLAGGSQLQFNSDLENQKLVVRLDRSYQPSEVVTLVIDYQTNGGSKGENLFVGLPRGLTFIKPTPDDPKAPRQIWSQGETEYNHYWFPCFDHPNDFFTSEMIATVKRPYMAISNGRLLETKDNNDGTRTFHWKMEQPHASYLTSIVVGEYSPIESSYAGIPVVSYVYPNEVEPGRITVARLPEMVKLFSEKTGVKYPYAKYAQTVVRGFPGAMENITATTHYDIMIIDARTELDTDSDSLQSHELAHQWFGDDVTCHKWADIWLNESFATFFQEVWDEYRLGRDEALYLDTKANQDAYYDAWNQGLRRPIVTNNYLNADALFDTYAYPRGSAVLHMLRNALGENNFWRAINYYLNKYAHQPASTENFRAAIEESTGQPMDWFFEEWIYKVGHPVFNVTKSYDSATKTLRVVIKQEQKPDSASPYPHAGLFRTPVDIEIVTPRDTRIERIMVEAKEDQAFSFLVDAEPSIVNFDYRDTLIKELKFEKSIDELAYQQKNDADIMGRIWSLGQLRDRLKSSIVTEPEKQRIAALIGDSVTSDKFWGMRFEAARALSGINNRPSRSALIAGVKDKDARVRAEAITSLATSKDPTLASLYENFLNDESYAVIRAAALALGETKAPNASDKLVKLLDVSSWRDQIRASALQGLSATGDKRAVDIAIHFAAPGNWPAVRGAALRLLGNIAKDDPRTFPLISQTLTRAVEDGHRTEGIAAAEALVVLKDKRGIELFEQLRKRSTNPSVQQFFTSLENRLRQSNQGMTAPGGH